MNILTELRWKLAKFGYWLTALRMSDRDLGDEATALMETKERTTAQALRLRVYRYEIAHRIVFRGGWMK